MKPTVSIRVQNSKFTALTPLSNGYNTNVNITATSTRQVDVPIEILNIRLHLQYQKLYTIRPHTIPTKQTSTSNTKQSNIFLVRTLHKDNTTCATSCSVFCKMSARIHPHRVTNAAQQKKSQMLSFRIWYNSSVCLPCVALLIHET